MYQSTIGGNTAAAIASDVDMENEKQVVQVLILDDNNFDRKRLRRIARQTGIRMEFTDAASVIAFEKFLDKGQYHLVFIDYRMPDANGIEAIRRLRAHPVNGNAAAIVVAGELESQKVAEAFKAGCTDYLSKESLDTKRLRFIALTALEAVEAAKGIGD